MKMTAIAICLAGLVAGCSSKKGDAPAAPATCKDVAVNTLALMKAKTIADVERTTGDKLDDTMKKITWAMQAEKAGLPTDPDKQVELIESSCVERGDSPDARSCFARAKSMDDLTSCQTKFLKK